jgi:hypothetical protein
MHGGELRGYPLGMFLHGVGVAVGRSVFENPHESGNVFGVRDEVPEGVAGTPGEFIGTLRGPMPRRLGPAVCAKFNDTVAEVPRHGERVPAGDESKDGRAPSAEGERLSPHERVE